MDLRALRVRPVRPPAAGRALGDPASAEADLQGDGQGRVGVGQPPVGARLAVLPDLRRASARRRRDRLARLRRAYRADLTLVVGGWNLLNLVIAGCALGVIAEKGQRRAATRRVKVSRRGELRVGGTWCPARSWTSRSTAPACRLRRQGCREARRPAARLHPLHALWYDSREGRPAGRRPQHGAGWPVDLRRLQLRGHRGLAPPPGRRPGLRQLRPVDPVPAVAARQPRPGRGFVWFFGLALFQTYRGLVYLVRSLRGGQRPAADTRLAPARSSGASPSSP